MPIFPKPVGVHNQTDSDRIIIEWLYEVSYKGKMRRNPLLCWGYEKGI